MKDKIDSLCKIAEEKCADFEKFPGYFKFKKIETLNIIDKVNFDKNANILEIGCGTGFQSSLLAECYGNIISTDLQYDSNMNYPDGLKNAREVASRLGVSNIDHLNCSAVKLPFKDKSFEYIFLFAVLEHIDDKKKALREMRRVLKDNGVMICSVPTYMASIFEFIGLYLYIVKRFFDITKNKVFKKESKPRSIFFKDNSKKASNHSMSDLLKTFFRNNPSFPFPEPHGDWRNKKGKLSIFVEFYEQLPWKWGNIILTNGLKITNSFAVLFIPYRIFEIFSPQFFTNVFCYTQFLHRRLADTFLKYFSVAICYICKKDIRINN